MMTRLPQEVAPAETNTADSQTSGIPAMAAEVGPPPPLSSEAVHRQQLKFASGARLSIRETSISRQSDGSFTFRGSLLPPVANEGVIPLDQATEIEGSGGVSSGHLSVGVTELTAQGDRYTLYDEGGDKRNGSGPAVEIVSGKVIEMWFSSASTYAKAATEQP